MSTDLDRYLDSDADAEVAPRSRRSQPAAGKVTLTRSLPQGLAPEAAAAASSSTQSASAGGAAPATGYMTGAGDSPDSSVRARLAATTGADLSGVRVHTDPGSARAAASVQAKAYTAGSDIFFADSQYRPGSAAGDRLLAHEMVHTLQQGDGSAAQRKAVDVSEPGDAAEREADHIAEVAMSASTATVVPVQRAAAVARVPETLSGNPAERTNATTGANTTTHRSPGLSDSINAPTAGTAADEARTTNVRVVADASSKLHVEPPASPPAAQIYEEDNSAASPAPAGFHTITGLHGTVAAPLVTQEANKSLYINGQPTADDVQQSGIGDCFFLAALMSVVSRDPGKITSMIASDGNGGGTVTLWRAEEHEPTIWERITGGAPERDWQQVAVTVNDQLAVRISNNRVMGAQLRCADSPKAADYWGDIRGSTLDIHRHDEFECGRWAPILEKAYARFAQTHGNYGGARPGGKTRASGYDAINGGWSYKALCVLYGPQADEAGSGLRQEQTSWSPTGGGVAANAAVMEQLILLQGRGAATQPGETDAPIVTATSSVAPLVRRLNLAIPAAQADADYANVGAARQVLVAATATSITTYNTTPPDPAPPGPKAAALTAIGNACVAAVEPGIDESAGQREKLEEMRQWDPNPITYTSGDDVVPAGKATRLTNMNAWLRHYNNPLVNARIDGHASTVGDEAENLALSQRRADNVETALLAGGAIAPHTTAKTAHGQTGATADPSWQKVTVNLDPSGHRTNSLLADARSQPIKNMADLMLDLRNIGTDNSSGQRNIYGDHVYSVVSVNIVTTTGDNVPLNAVPARYRPLLYPLVDPDVSMVVLRNPHHGNEPDRRHNDTPSRAGDGAPSGAQSDGTFTMSLSEFFRNFTSVDSGVFPRS